MWPDNRFKTLVGIDHPIIQAPMAGSSGLDMALAVSSAGGLGSLACATHDADSLRETLAKAFGKTTRPLNVNFFAHPVPGAPDRSVDRWQKHLSPYFEERAIEQPANVSAGPIQPFDTARCAVLEQYTPAVVSFHFGLPPADLVTRIKRAGAKVMSTATTVGEATWLAENGCDAVIAQGYEAGGHRGMFLTDDIATQIGTLALVPQIADAVDIPVIAAGGIADERGIVAALALGASAVQIGTAFLFTAEATVNCLYRKTLQDAGTGATALTNVFSGRPTRCAVNRVMQDQGPMATDAPAFPMGFAAMAPLRAAAEADGSRDFSAHHCGQAAALGREMSAAQLVRHLAEGSRGLIGRMSVAAR